MAAFRAFVGAPPWAWRAEHLDAYGKALRERQLARESIRSKQGAIRRFLDFARDPAYDWADRCLAATGQSIRQIATRDNTVRHQYGAATTKRRNLTGTELAQLFLAVRTAIAAAARGCDQRTRQMHYAVLQFGLGFGCREHEIEMGDVADLAAAESPQIRAYSAFEDFSVRFGKSHDGGPSKRRNVVATYPFRNAFAVLAWYLRELRPALVRPASPDAIFLNVPGGRLRGDSISAIFTQYRRAAGLSPDLTFHCLRHTYGTILRECGFELGVIAHCWATTTCALRRFTTTWDWTS